MIAAARPLARLRWYHISLAALILGAWAILGLWGNALHLHVAMEMSGGTMTMPLQLPGFAAGWMLMAIAMMLPGSLPHVNHIHRFTPRGASGWQVILFVTGYLALYEVFGLAIYLVISTVQMSAGASTLLSTIAPEATGAILVTVGAYQLTPVKEACLEQCRAPQPAEKHTHLAGRSCMRLGVRHGLWCLGSCGGLMLLMFVFGGLQLWAMLFLGAIMAAEKTLHRDRRVAQILGLALLLAGTLSLLGYLPLVVA
jgi:predicted metal-binding membrane protein